MRVCLQTGVNFGVKLKLVFCKGHGKMIQKTVAGNLVTMKIPPLDHWTIHLVYKSCLKGRQTGPGEQIGLKQMCKGQDQGKGNVSNLVFKLLLHTLKFL